MNVGVYCSGSGSLLQTVPYTLARHWVKFGSKMDGTEANGNWHCQCVQMIQGRDPSSTIHQAT